MEHSTSASASSAGSPNAPLSRLGSLADLANLAGAEEKMGLGGLKFNKACSTCSAAKLKCIQQSADVPSDDPSKCERCYRLKKECKVIAAKPRKKRQPDKTRVAQLEKRLDSIVNLLSTSKSPISGQPEPELPKHWSDKSPSQGSPSSATSALPHRSFANENTQSPGSGPQFRSLLDHGQNAYNTPESGAAFGVPTVAFQDEDSLVESYRTKQASMFPFVIIPDNMTAEELKRARPYLHRVILWAAAPPARSLRGEYGKELLRELSDRLFMEGEKSLDLLQGIIILVGWYHKTFITKPQLTNLLQLMVALVVDLGLNKAPNFHDRQKVAIFATENAHGNQELSTTRTNEERRALAGCFYLTSSMSTSFKRLDPLWYSPHMEECCQVLAAEKEYPSDERLVYMVRIQHLTQRIVQTLSNESSSNNMGKAPITMCVKSFQLELKDINDGLPERLKNDTIMLLQLRCAEVHLYEIGLHMPPSFGVHAGLGPDTLARRDILYSCLRATKSFLSIYFECLSIIDFHHGPLLCTWTQMSYVLVIGSKITLFKANDWDVQYARNQIDFVSVLDRCIMMVDMLMAALRQDAVLLPAVDTFFEQCTIQTKWLRGWYQSMLAMDEEKTAAGAVGVDEELGPPLSHGKLRDREQVQQRANALIAPGNPQPGTGGPVQNGVQRGNVNAVSQDAKVGESPHGTSANTENMQQPSMPGFGMPVMQDAVMGGMFDFWDDSFWSETLGGWNPNFNVNGPNMNMGGYGAGPGDVMG